MPTTPAEPLPPPPGTEVLVDQARLVQANMPSLLLGNLATVSITAAALWLGGQQGAGLLAWTLAQALVTVLGAWRAGVLRHRPPHAGNALRRLRSYPPGMGVAGALWGLGLAGFWGHVPVEQQLVLLVTASGSVTGALHAFVAWRQAFLAFFVPVVAGLIAGCLSQGGVLSYAIAAASVGYGLFNARFAVLMQRSVLESLRAKHRVAALAADLQRQKALAEQASAEKSRFLAAASHDLRQPVHALSLMVGALRAQPPGPDAERMLSRLDATVTAIGQMFGTLLDLSRLDAGMVQVEHQPVDARLLAERLATEFAVVAQGRGLRLAVVAPPEADALWVRTDPVLLERILRNLLANAVRYTERGGVRIRLRRAGQQVLVRVIDTGPGIAANQHAAVFQEFVQLHNPERDRHKGLGLGLAIVRRLCALLDIGLALRSSPGHGAAFTLRLPGAPAPAAVAVGAAPAGASGPALRGVVAGDLVLVVDDDADVLDSMTALLRGWGCQVVAATGLDDLLPQLLTLAVAPRLVVCDHRLRDGLTGTQVVARLRDEFNDDLPALLVTGDTAPDRLREAAASGLTLLHKPVKPQDLGAAMARVLAAADDDRR